jgi:hypothetical protein
MIAEQLGNVSKLFEGIVSRRSKKDNSSSLAPESPDDLKQFTEEQRRLLEDKGYMIISLSGDPVSEMIKKGVMFESSVEGVKNISSRKSQVAILNKMPSNRRIMNAYRSDWTKEEESEWLSNKDENMYHINEKDVEGMSGVKTACGNVADWIEVANAYFKETGKHFFNTRQYVKTADGDASTRVIVGRRSEEKGLFVDISYKPNFSNYTHYGIFIVPE